MPIQSAAYGKKRFRDIDGYRMAYVDEGDGNAIVFQHGNPTSSYLWRNVMPHCVGLGRLIACDLIGMGDSDKLIPSGPDRYTFSEHSRFLDALWEDLDLGDRIILVLHDWGSALGFDWARRHADRVAGIVYMESIVRPMSFPPGQSRAGDAAKAMRSAAGEEMMLIQNAFIEQRLPASIMRELTDDEMAVYRKPFLTPGEDRRPTLAWPRELPIDGDPKDVHDIVTAYGDWLAETQIPKLFINAEPGILLTGEAREFCRSWPNQTEITVRGLHFIQEDSPDDIGQAIAKFAQSLRAAG